MRPALLLTLLVMVGCKDVRIDSGSDSKFLHTPEALFAPLPAPEKTLLPQGVGSHWTYRLTGAETGTEEQLLTERRADGTVKIEGRRVGRPVHVEFYLSTPQGVSLAGAGEKDLLMMTPPLPIFQLPFDADKTLEWQGGISVPKGSVPGRGWSLVRGQETVTVPAGTFLAYRTDTTLEANVSGQLALFLTSRWFAPGVGIVKTRYVIRQVGQAEQQFARELVRYKLTP